MRAQPFSDPQNSTEAGPAGTETRPAGPLRRAAALAAVVLLVGLYLAAFILAVAGDARSAGLFRFCLGMTIFVPLFLWVIIWCAGVFRGKKSIASLNILDSNPEERRKMEEAAAAAAENDAGQNFDR